MTDEKPIRKDQTANMNTATLADGTLGGYLDQHHRPPAFEGTDGSPYTVSIEVEKTPDLKAPYSGYLVFPRWANTGAGIVGHLETPTLATGTGRAEVEEMLRALTLHDVNQILADAIARRNQEID